MLDIILHSFFQTNIKNLKNISFLWEFTLLTIEHFNSFMTEAVII